MARPPAPAPALPTLLDGSVPAQLLLAAECLHRGALLGLPTETVYGLAADASNDAAVAAIFAAKGRPRNHPLIVHVADAAAVPTFAAAVPAFAAALMQAFWPGPLTLILPRRAGVASAAAAAQASIGLRCPAHPVAQALLRAAAGCGVAGVAAPSANRFGRVSPTTAQHVASEFAEHPDLLILDGGPCDVGIESTIIDCTRGVPVLLRPGAITAEQVEAACGSALVSPDALEAQGQQAPRASGTLESHYAPHATVRLMPAKALQQALDMLGADVDKSPDGGGAIAVYARTKLKTPARSIAQRRMPSDPALAAHELFAVLRELDALHVKLIWVEEPPAGTAWDGVRDRLQRAAA